MTFEKMPNMMIHDVLKDHLADFGLFLFRRVILSPGRVKTTGGKDKKRSKKKGIGPWVYL